MLTVHVPEVTNKVEGMIQYSDRNRTFTLVQPYIFIWFGWLLASIYRLFSVYIINPLLDYSNHYFSLPTIYNECTESDSIYTYLLQIDYGFHNKQLFFPETNISLIFYDAEEKEVFRIFIESFILTKNHRKYLKMNVNKIVPRCYLQGNFGTSIYLPLINYAFLSLKF